MNSSKRKALYRLAVAIGAVLLAYGVATADELEAWLQVVGALLLIANGGVAEKYLSDD